jgi:hypothetical protein
LFQLLLAFQWKKLSNVAKRLGCAAGFAKATEQNTHGRESTSEGAADGFPQLCPLNAKRYKALPSLFSLFTDVCHRCRADPALHKPSRSSQQSIGRTKGVT